MGAFGWEHRKWMQAGLDLTPDTSSTLARDTANGFLMDKWIDITWPPILNYIESLAKIKSTQMWTYRDPGRQ